MAITLWLLSRLLFSSFHLCFQSQEFKLHGHHAFTLKQELCLKSCLQCRSFRRFVLQDSQNFLLEVCQGLVNVLLQIRNIIFFSAIRSTRRSLVSKGSCCWCLRFGRQEQARVIRHFFFCSSRKSDSLHTTKSYDQAYCLLQTSRSFSDHK